MSDENWQKDLEKIIINAGTETADILIKYTQIAETDEFKKWQIEIPYISFHPNWEIKAVPPMGGTILHYYLRHKKNLMLWFLSY